MVKMFHMTCFAIKWLCRRLILSTNKVKIIIVRYMLKSVNTPMQKNVAC